MYDDGLACTVDSLAAIEKCVCTAAISFKIWIGTLRLGLASARKTRFNIHSD